jgi:hypothetical protein
LRKHSMLFLRNPGWWPAYAPQTLRGSVLFPFFSGDDWPRNGGFAPFDRVVAFLIENLPVNFRFLGAIQLRTGAATVSPWAGLDFLLFPARVAVNSHDIFPRAEDRRVTPGRSDRLFFFTF